jgi:uncharacterized protein YbaP (TraB family)
MKNKVLFFWLMLVSACFLFGQSNKQYPSLLWKISGNGLKKDSYLYGTMHVSNRVAYHLSDQFFDAIKSSQVVGLETNPSEWLYNMELIGELSKSSGVGLYSPYSGNFYKSVFGMKFPDKTAFQAMLVFDPEIINALLFRNDKAQENFQENTYIDMFIFQAASKMNKPVISLEDFRKAEIMSKLAMVPDSELGLEEDNADYTGRNMQLISSKIEDAYRNGDLDAIDSLTQLIESKNMQTFLLHKRNVFFLNTIDSVLKSGSTLFSGVGAAHLPGKKGLIELLRSKGYELTPIMPKQTKKSIKEQQKLESIVKNVSGQKQFAGDSLFSVSVPGRLSKIMDYENIKYYINADMINGNFYTIARLKTNAILYNYSIDAMMQKLDSLFFENIPGKITSKKIIENNGYKGFDIVSKTRSGDIERYQIYFTEIEMLLFKLGGKGAFVNTTSGKEFFSSIRFENKLSSQTLFEPATGGFKVSIPNEFNFSRNDYVGVVGLVEDLSAFDKNTKMYYGVKHAIYNDFYYLEQDTFELNRLSAYTLQNFGFKNNIKVEYTSEFGVPAVTLKATNANNLHFHGKIFIKGIHYYLAYSIGSDSKGFDQTFFKSFKLNDFIYICEIKEIKDPDLGFKTLDESSSTPAGKFNEELNRMYKAVKDSLNPPKKDYYDFDYYTKTKNYYSPSSHEYAEIFFEKYSDYDYRDKKELSARILKNLGESLTMNVRQLNSSDKDGVWFAEYKLTDTATVRAILAKVFVKAGAVYQLKVPFDTLLGLSGWSKSFYENFNVSDTTIGKDLFKYKFNDLLDDLGSSDTAVSKKASYSIANSLSMEKAYLNDFIDFIKSDKLKKVSPEVKAQLFVNGGVMGSDRITDVYTKLYNDYSDSAYLQICLIKGLAYCKTQKAYQTILNLLLQEAPLVGDAGVAGDVLKTMQDSLELCVPLFPKLLKLTEHQEYIEPVYKMLSVLVKNKMISAAVLNPVKSKILSDANAEFKRFNSSQSGKSKSSNQYNLANKDMGIEETIELIKANLRDMSTRQMLKNKKVMDVYQSASQPLLLSYIYILSPLYSSDVSVKTFIDKTRKIRNEQIAMPAFINLLKNNIANNDTLVRYYAGNVYTRSYFYNELENEKIPQLFPNEFRKQELLNQSFLKSYMKLNAYSSYEQESKDSLVLFSERPAENKYEKGRLYFYKTAKNKFGLSKWSAVFVKEENKDNVSAAIQVFKLNEVFDEKLSDSEILNSITDDFTNSYRSRISSYSGGVTFDY